MRQWDFAISVKLPRKLRKGNVFSLVFLSVSLSIWKGHHVTDTWTCSNLGYPPAPAQVPPTPHHTDTRSALNRSLTLRHVQTSSLGPHLTVTPSPPNVLESRRLAFDWKGLLLRKVFDDRLVFISDFTA